MRKTLEDFESTFEEQTLTPWSCKSSSQELLILFARYLRSSEHWDDTHKTKPHNVHLFLTLSALLRFATCYTPRLWRHQGHHQVKGSFFPVLERVKRRRVPSELQWNIWYVVQYPLACNWKLFFFTRDQVFWGFTYSGLRLMLFSSGGPRILGRVAPRLFLCELSGDHFLPFFWTHFTCIQNCKTFRPSD